MLVSLESLAENGLLEPHEAHLHGGNDEHGVDFPAVVEFKEARLRRAFTRLAKGPAAMARAFEEFLADPPSWLPDYVLFAAVREARAASLVALARALARSRQAALDDVRSGGLAGDPLSSFLQFVFERQWAALARQARDRGIPPRRPSIYVARAPRCGRIAISSVLLPDGARAVAGVPPDYFSADGQLWAIRSIAGTSTRARATHGGSTVCEPAQRASMSCASITSSVS